MSRAWQRGVFFTRSAPLHVFPYLTIFTYFPALSTAASSPVIDNSYTFLCPWHRCKFSSRWPKLACFLRSAQPLNNFYKNEINHIRSRVALPVVIWGCSVSCSPSLPLAPPRPSRCVCTWFSKCCAKSNCWARVILNSLPAWSAPWTTICGPPAPSVTSALKLWGTISPRTWVTCCKREVSGTLDSCAFVVSVTSL